MIGGQRCGTRREEWSERRLEVEEHGEEEGEEEEEGEQILIYNDSIPQQKPDPDDAGPIVRRPIGLPMTAGCDTAWNLTRDCSDSSSTERQYLRLLHHSGEKEEEEGRAYPTGEPTFPWSVSAPSPTIHPCTTQPGPQVTVARVLELFLKVVGTCICSSACNGLQQENGRG